VTSMFTPNMYNRGTTEEEDQNLLAGSISADTAGELATEIVDNAWRILEASLGTGGTTLAQITTDVTRNGSASLQLSLSAAGAPDNGLKMFSPVFDLIPGETYMVAAWAGKTESGTARSYLRVAGGTDVDLTEYPGSTSGTGIPTHITWESQDLPQLGDPVDTSLMKRIAMVFTVPENIVYGALRVYNWQPTSGSTHYWSDFELYQLTGDGAYGGDTGNIEVDYINTTNFEGYGSPEDRTIIRRIGNAVYCSGTMRQKVAGIVDASGGSSENLALQVPVGFRPNAYVSIVCQGSSNNRWAFRMNTAGELYPQRYGPSSSGVGTWLPHTAVSWITDDITAPNIYEINSGSGGGAGGSDVILPPMLWGTAIVPFDDTGHTSNVAVTFSTPFPVTPTVMITSANVGLNVSYAGVSTTGFTAYARRLDLTNQGSDVTVSWFAISSA